MTGEHTSVIYGTHYPYRLFVGCLPPEAGAEDLGTFFCKFGNVVEAKVVLDDKGRSKRFGFVTFSNKEDVAELIKNRAIKFHGKMINVGPAVKKNLENENQDSRAPTPTATMAPPAPTTTTTTTAKKSPPALPPQIKQSIYRGVNKQAPQHVPKTVIRPSPTDEHLIPNGDTYNNFCNMWGISNRKNSVWSNNQNYVHQSNASDVTSHTDCLDTSYSSLLSFNTSLRDPFCLSNHSLPWDTSALNRYGVGVGSIAPPPGFFPTDLYRK